MKHNRYLYVICCDLKAINPFSCGCGFKPVGFFTKKNSAFKGAKKMAILNPEWTFSVYKVPKNALKGLDEAECIADF